MASQGMLVGIGRTQTTSFSNRKGRGLGTMGAVVEVPHVLSYPVARKTVAREALTCGNAAVRHTFAISLYYICDPVDVTAVNVTVLQSCCAARKMRKDYGYGWDICRTRKEALIDYLWFNLKSYHLSNTVKLPLSGLIGTASHPDMQKIRIIGFFFKNRLHWPI